MATAERAAIFIYYHFDGDGDDDDNGMDEMLRSDDVYYFLRWEHCMKIREKPHLDFFYVLGWEAWQKQWYTK